MNQLRKHEDEVRTWKTDYSPQSMKLYNDYLKIAHSIEVDYNGDNGFEIVEGVDKFIVNLQGKRCTCRAWNPISSCNKSMLVYKIDPSQAMEPLELVNQASRLKVKRDRQNDEASKRQREWSQSRKGRIMTCGNCEEASHNARGCKKPLTGQKVTKKKKPSNDGHTSRVKKPAKRQRTLLDQDTDDDEVLESQEESEDISLSAPQVSQTSQGIGSSQSFIFMPTPTLDHFSDVDDGPEAPLRPSILSESQTRLMERQHVGMNIGTRTIKFTGDNTGVNKPVDLPYSYVNLAWKGKATIIGNQLEMQM
nr:uncharacterized protein LOC117275686 [Nicotiana tomentosiformis]